MKDTTKFLEERELSIAEICKAFHVPISSVDGIVSCSEVHRTHVEAFVPYLRQWVKRIGKVYRGNQ